MEIVFVDPRLEAAIRAALGRSDGPITPEMMSDLRELEARGCGIVQLNGLEHCTKLENLFLENNAIVSVEPLGRLSHLITLSLDQNQIRDIGPLRTLAQLVVLGLCSNPLHDLEPIRHLRGLARLSLSLDGICDIQPLVECEGLGAGDWIYFMGQPSATEPITSQVRTLRHRGVIVYGVP